MLMVFSNINQDTRQEGGEGAFQIYFFISIYFVLKVLQTILSANLLVTKLQCSSSVALHHKILWQHRTTNAALLLPSGKLSDLEDQASCRGAVRGAQVRAG